MRERHLSLKSLWGLDAVTGFTGRSKSSENRHIPELLGLRGVAIIIVLLGHFFQRIVLFYDQQLSLADTDFFWIFATPFSGCCIFFCISGYSMMLFMRARQDNSSIFWFRWRRIIRLIPPYYVVMISTYIFILATRYEPEGATHFFLKPNSLLESLVASLVLSHDILFANFPRLFPPGWFIETQFQFYLVAPVVWAFYLRFKAGVARLWIGLAVLAALYWISLLTTEIGPANLKNTIMAYSPYFWIGALIADSRSILADKAAHIFSTYRQIGWIALAAFVIVGTPFGNMGVQLAARLFCLPVIVGASLVAGNSFHRAMVNRWLTRIGVASYSIYLVHLQILQVLTPFVIHKIQQPSIFTAIVVCGVVGISAVTIGSACFYWLVERPCVAITTGMSPPVARVV